MNKAHGIYLTHYLGSIDTNYIILRNDEIFNFYLFQNTKICEGIYWIIICNFKISVVELLLTLDPF
jgi:hypothetical protein